MWIIHHQEYHHYLKQCWNRSISILRTELVFVVFLLLLLLLQVGGGTQAGTGRLDEPWASERLARELGLQLVAQALFQLTRNLPEHLWKACARAQVCLYVPGVRAWLRACGRNGYGVSGRVVGTSTKFYSPRYAFAQASLSEVQQFFVECTMLIPSA